MFLYFLRTIQLLHNIIFTDVLGITQRITSLKKPFTPTLPLGAILRYFRGSIWGMLLYFWELFPIFSYEILYRCFSYYSDSKYTKKDFNTYIPLLGALWSILGPTLGTFLNALRKLKHSLDILHECLDITMVVTKLRNVLGLPLLWAFFGCFLSIILYYVPQIVRNQLTFSS